MVSTNSPEELTIAVNSPLELECSAVGVPPPTLSWLKDGRPLERTGTVQQDGHFVRISKVQVYIADCVSTCAPDTGICLRESMMPLFLINHCC